MFEQCLRISTALHVCFTPHILVIGVLVFKCPLHCSRFLPPTLLQVISDTRTTHTHTHTHTHSLTLTHTLSHTLTLTHTHTHSLYIYIYMFLFCFNTTFIYFYIECLAYIFLRGALWYYNP
jgi:hypothetical protein